MQLRGIQVIKRDGSIQLFDREKIRHAIEKAVHKRKISPAQIEKLVNAVSRQLEQIGETEIPTSKIGNVIMTSLQEIDPVAYIRFCSVYQDFTNVQDFVKIITSMNDTNNSDMTKEKVYASA